MDTVEPSSRRTDDPLYGSAAFVSLLAVLGPVAIAIGTAFASGEIREIAVLPVLFGALLLDLGANVAPGYLYLRSEAARRTTFSRSHHPLARLWTARGIFVVVIALAAYLIAITGAGLLLLIAGAVFTGVLYRSPPEALRLRGRLWGLAFLLMGPGLAFGSFYALTGAVALLPAIAAVPSGLVTAAALGVRRAVDRTDAPGRILDSRVRLFSGALIVTSLPLLALLVTFGALPRGCLAGVLAAPWTAMLLCDLIQGRQAQGPIRTRAFALSLGLAILVAAGAVIG